ncbi:MAG: DNRLRE domain-containing protein [Bacteroidota bacterium]
MKFTVLAGIVAGFGSFLFSQQEVSVVSARDNTLYEDPSGAVSNGAGVHVFAGKTNSGAIRRGLIFFDLSGSIPAGSTVTDVNVKLHMSKTAAGATDIKLHKVTASWGEGTSDAGSNEGSGATSTTGDATWIHRSFNTQTWTTAGGDFAPTASVTLSVTDTGVYQFGSTAQLVADVQGWVNDQSTNHGWIIIGDESTNQTAKRFDTRENATAANRPLLIVKYSIVNSVHTAGKTPNEFALHQNFPNPFNPATVIRYSIPVSGHVSLKVFDILGNEIASLVNEVKGAGTFTQKWNAAGLPSGLYFYRLTSGNFVSTKKMFLVK